MHYSRRRLLHTLAAAPLGAVAPLSLARAARAADTSPVLIGIDGEFSLQNSRSAQAVEMGIRCAIDEIERRGGVLGGRSFEVVTRDHGSIAARGIRNLREFAAMPGLLAVFAGRFSPVVLEEMDLIRETRTLLMAPWSSADAIVDNGMQPNYVFRLSLRDSLAMPKLLRTCAERGIAQVGLLLTNTGWGRSNLAAAKAYGAAHATPRIAATAWYNFRDTSLIEPYRHLRDAGAEAIVLVANDDEAAVLVREIAALPPSQRLPILSHWGVSGGDFVRQAGPALWEVDFSVIQTFSFFNAAQQRPAAWKRFLAVAGPRYGIERPEQIAAPVGVAHAYDLMHILALAVQRAGSAERPRVRDALEQVRDHDGLIKRYAQPFTPARHEALDAGDLLMARYRPDGALVPEGRKPVRKAA
ncbi:ABC transporter substrate-binding protein [Azohydromonas aeria]|uniref:ABC transporter substrate-binding protein n=1 Tax=Azohydromonas aeria TaxID=2590212 RepID=UPI0012F97927|nr:ABC transporter substrate-binding protein [Azohydromonas aeria]